MPWCSACLGHAVGQVRVSLICGPCLIRALAAVVCVPGRGACVPATRVRPGRARRFFGASTCAIAATVDPNVGDGVGTTIRRAGSTCRDPEGGRWRRPRGVGRTRVGRMGSASVGRAAGHAALPALPRSNQRVMAAQCRRRRQTRMPWCSARPGYAVGQAARLLRWTVLGAGACCGCVRACSRRLCAGSFGGLFCALQANEQN